MAVIIGGESFDHVSEINWKSADASGADSETLFLRNYSFPNQVKDSNLATAALSGGGDLRFFTSLTDPDGTRLACDVIVFEPNTIPGDAEIIVAVDNSAGTFTDAADATLYCASGNATATQPGRTTTYGRDNAHHVRAYWPCEETPAAALEDRTANGFDLDNVVSDPVSVGAVVEKGLSFDTGDAYYSANGGLNGMGSAGFSLWFKLNSTGQSGKYMFGNPWVSSGSNGVDMYLTSTTLGGHWKAGSFLTFAANWTQDTNWHHFCVRYDGSNVKSYLDGVEHTSNALTGNTVSSSEVNLNRFGSSGGNADASYDEVILLDDGKSQGFVETLFAMTKDTPTILAAGTFHENYSPKTLHDDLHWFFPYNETATEGPWYDTVEGAQLSDGNTNGIESDTDNKHGGRSLVANASSSSERLEPPSGHTGLNKAGFTFAGWAKRNGAANTATVVRLERYLDGSDNRVYLEFNSVNCVLRWNANNAGEESISAPLPANDTWTFFCCRFDDTAGRVDLDIDQTNYNDTLVSISFTNNLNLLYTAFCPAGVSVNIDSWGFWDRVLTDAEVDRIYNGGNGQAEHLDRAPPPDFAELSANSITPEVSEPDFAELSADGISPQVAEPDFAELSADSMTPEVSEPDFAELSADGISPEAAEPDFAELSADSMTLEVSEPDFAELSADGMSPEAAEPDFAELSADSMTPEVSAPDFAELSADAISPEFAEPDFAELSADAMTPELAAPLFAELSADAMAAEVAEPDFAELSADAMAAEVAEPLFAELSSDPISFALPEPDFAELWAAAMAPELTEPDFAEVSADTINVTAPGPDFAELSADVVSVTLPAPDFADLIADACHVSTVAPDYGELWAGFVSFTVSGPDFAELSADALTVDLLPPRPAILKADRLGGNSTIRRIVVGDVVAKTATLSNVEVT